MGRLFRTIVGVEGMIESLKGELAKRKKFTLDSAFKLLNMEGWDKVSIEDL